MNFFPVGEDENQWFRLCVSNPSVTLECLKFEKDGALTVRLYNSLEVETDTEFILEKFGIKEVIRLGARQFKSFRLSKGVMDEVNVLGEKR